MQQKAKKSKKMQRFYLQRETFFIHYSLQGKEKEVKKMKIWDTTTFWGRVDEKLDKKGLDLNTMCKECDIKPRTVYTGRSLNRIPRSKGTVVKLANFLCTTPEYLMTGENDQNGLTPEEERLLLLYSQLPVDKRELVFELIKSLI